MPVRRQPAASVKGLRGLADGEAGGQGHVFGQGAGAGWEDVAGGNHGDDFAAFAETSSTSSSSRLSIMGVPDVLDGAGEVHLGYVGLVSQKRLG